MTRKIAGTIKAAHLDEPEKEFLVHVLRGAVFNEYVRKERWELWKVKASSRGGAIDVAKYHFYRAKEIVICGEADSL